MWATNEFQNRGEAFSTVEVTEKLVRPVDHVKAHAFRWIPPLSPAFAQRRRAPHEGRRGKREHAHPDREHAMEL